MGSRWFLVLALASGACAVQPRSGASPRGTLAEVVEAEGARDASSEAIKRALGAQQPMLRVAALRALARIEAADGAALAAPLIGDRDPIVATWAAFALGQMPGPVSEAALFDAIGGASTAPEAALLALGRSGTATAAREVAAHLEAETPARRAAAALALGLAAKRLGKALPQERWISALTKLLKDPDREVRFGAGYALMRFATPKAGLALLPALSDRDVELRAQAARGIGLAGVAPQLLDTVLDDPEWRVRVEAARALALVGSSTRSETAQASARLSTMASQEIKRLKAADGALASGTSTLVLLELIQGALSIGEPADRVRNQIQASLGELPPPARGAESDRTRLDCALAFAEDAVSEQVQRVLTCGDATLLAWRRHALEAELWSRRKEEGVAPLKALAAHADERVRAAATDALGRIATDQARAALVELLRAEDPYVAAAAAGGLATPFEQGLVPAGARQALEPLLQRLLQQSDPGFATAVIDTMGALGTDGTQYLPALEKLDADPRAAIRRRAAQARAAITGKAVPFAPAPEEGDPSGYGPLASGRTEVRVETTRGNFVMTVFGDVAPRTTAQFLGLVESGFYSGKTFHRVVADFVAQGGCPRGDGWGGPGRAVLDETSPLPFARGAVGMATSGRDTGGSQFFVMHTHHPHLEGGYTLFGQVTEGMEVVDALVPDDRILQMKAEDGSRSQASVR